MGQRINEHMAKIKEDKARRAELEIQLSKENQPKYLKWLWKNKKSNIALTIAGVIGSVLATPIIASSDNGIPVAAMVVSFVALYGFTIGMILQPYTIYRGLIKINYWSPNSPYQKNNGK